MSSCTAVFAVSASASAFAENCATFDHFAMLCAVHHHFRARIKECCRSSRLVIIMRRRVVNCLANNTLQLYYLSSSTQHFEIMSVLVMPVESV